MTPEIPQKNAKYFICETCDFKCSKNSDFNRHLSTLKHMKLLNANNMLDNATIKNAISHNQRFNCVCGNSYSHSSSYYRHKKICNVNKDNNETSLNTSA